MATANIDIAAKERGGIGCITSLLEEILPIDKPSPEVNRTPVSISDKPKTQAEAIRDILSDEREWSLLQAEMKRSGFATNVGIQQVMAEVMAKRIEDKQAETDNKSQLCAKNSLLSPLPTSLLGFLTKRPSLTSEKILKGESSKCTDSVSSSNSYLSTLLWANEWDRHCLVASSSCSEESDIRRNLKASMDVPFEAGFPWSADSRSKEEAKKSSVSLHATLSAALDLANDALVLGNERVSPTIKKKVLKKTPVPSPEPQQCLEESDEEEDGDTSWLPWPEIMGESSVSQGETTKRGEQLPNGGDTGGFGIKSRKPNETLHSILEQATLIQDLVNPLA